jgi:hypothetical protein
MSKKEHHTISLIKPPPRARDPAEAFAKGGDCHELPGGGNVSVSIFIIQIQ